MDINRLAIQTKAFCKWITGEKTAFMGVAGIAASFLTILAYPTPKTVRISGYFLQLAGMLITMHGLVALRKYFKLSPFYKLFISWLKRCPARKKHYVKASGTSTVATSILEAKGHVWTPDHPELSLEKRMTAMDKNQERLKEDLNTQEQQINALKKNFAENKIQTKKDVEDIDQKYHRTLKDIHLTGMLVYLVGLIWLTIGISLSSLSPEIIALIQQL